MAYSVEGHVADIRLRVSGGSLEELFADAVAGLFDILRAAPAEGARPVEREIVVDAADTTSLLIDFLGDVLARAHIAREAFESVRFQHLTATELKAVLTGYVPARFERDVKAVTYHEADVVRTDGEWSTTIVLDI